VAARQHVMGATHAMDEADLVLVLADGSRLAPGLQASLEHIPAAPPAGRPAVAVLTKSDLTFDAAMRANISAFVLAKRPELCAPLDGFPAPPYWVSATLGTGVAGLRTAVLSRAQPGPWLFPAGAPAVASLPAQVADAIREQLLRHCDKEVPYVARHETTALTRDPASGGYAVEHAILVGKSSHKGMVLGTKGTRVVAMSADAQADLAARWGAPVALTLTVRVLDKMSWMRVKAQAP
jgi:GTPase Era involved in 16S rRNA processing